MAHYAKLNGSNVVETVVVIDNDDCLDGEGNESEAVGIAFCRALFGNGTTWKKTSYNTYGNAHALSGTPFRKNYAGIGGTYDSSKDAFIASQPFASWTLNNTTCLWECPLTHPSDDTKRYYWDESAYQGDNSIGWREVVE